MWEPAVLLIQSVLLGRGPRGVSSSGSSGCYIEISAKLGGLVRRAVGGGRGCTVRMFDGDMLPRDPASGTIVDVGRPRPARPSWYVPATGPVCPPPAGPRPSAATLTTSPPGARVGPRAWTTSSRCARPTTGSSTPPDGPSPGTRPAGCCRHTPDRVVYQRHLDGTIIRRPRQRYVPSAVVPADLSKQISPEILDRLDTVLDNQPPRPHRPRNRRRQQRKRPATATDPQRPQLPGADDPGPVSATSAATLRDWRSGRCPGLRGRPDDVESGHRS